MTKLKDFLVLEKLIVESPKVEPGRISATYKVVQFDGTEEQTELIYTYRLKLFDHSDAADLNLAGMMVSQVALNYGLFCKEIEFRGLYDKTDRGFIRDMMENTSREILTNKLLNANEFLVKPYDQLSIEKRETYTQARILFSNANNPAGTLDGPKVDFSKDKYAILSSGGKDSLLSYGLIKEFGEPHPVFVNEAGRHWFTAVNAHRYLADKEPNTARVWCNSDRVFNWMLRRLKFIRKDFSNVRADIYPVRLWTVAVFLFGVLPLAIKKGLGNVIIGDEYDTTLKTTTHGVTNYQALYDQSKYFDNAMTRYYRKKGWALNQYSLLRSLSEMLIMKVLLKRYPELQKQQLSCHAAHQKNQRMYPCGNCEKCRRIIGMICALDEDPRQCGYSSIQIEKALSQIAEKKVKQIGSDASHLYHLLFTKGVIPENQALQKAVREHPQVMKLRFDSERSNLIDMPMHVRKPLFHILKQYAEGAAMRKESKWQELEIDDSFLTLSKYKYDESKK